MPKAKLMHFSEQLRRCSCYDTIFNSEFDTDSTDSKSEFSRKLRDIEADAAVVCLCSTHEDDVGPLLQMEALSGPLPVVTCSETLNPDFIRTAAQQGVDRFLLCTMDVTKIQEIIQEAIRRGGLKEYLEACCPGSLTASPYVRKMVDEIVHAFPHRLNESEMARRLNISRRWLQKLCRHAFGKPFTTFLRRIWVHQALRLMQHIDLDNTEIALQLNFSEESNMARDFRKELGISPSKARKLLVKHSPEELLISKSR